MLKIAYFLASFLFLSGTPCSATEPSTPFTVLEGRHAQQLAQPCSRAKPPAFQDTWQPSEEEIKELEERLSLLQHLKSSLCCHRDGRIKSVHAYYRQYVGIVVDGRKLIYINAFEIRSLSEDHANGEVLCREFQPHRSDCIRNFDQAHERWRQEPITACDGGDSFWGAIYNPQSKDFSDLAFNGAI
ncbi:MAG: hypothetical protein JSR20_10250 [Nitrospira sp.]|nr:hypothetical protein [Nitrospira sp.]